MKHLLTGLVLINFISAGAQDCVSYFPVKEGTVIENQHFNAKDKLESSDKQTVLTKATTVGGWEITVKSESYDEKNTLQFSKNLKYECKNGIFIFDMQNFLDPQTASAYKDMQVTMTAKNLEFEGSLSAGKSLPDGNIEMKVQNQGMTLMNMTVNVTNRKVEANEKITTPAGTFDCYKITYDVETKVMFKVVGKGIDWIAKEVGVVRSETYDSKGKLNSYSVLSSIK